MKKRSLFNIFTYNFILILIIPIFSLYIFSSAFIINSIYSDKIETSETITENMADRLDDDLVFYSLVVGNIANNEIIDELLKEWAQSNNKGEIHDISIRIDTAINTLFNYSKIFKGVKFTFLNGREYTYGENIDKTNLLNSDIKRLERNKVYLLNDYIEEGDIELVVPLENYGNGVDTILLSINNPILLNDHFQNSIELNSVLAVKESIIQDGYNNKLEFERSKVYYYTFKNIGKFDLVMICKYDFTPIIYLVLKMVLIMSFIFAIMLICMYFFHRLYQNKILTPIINTVNKVNKVKDEDLNQYFEGSGIKEIDILNGSLNGMILKINSLIHENKKIAEEKLELEIRALQTQITPHFMFNTLNSIRVQALINGDKEVGNSIKSFSHLLKGVFTKGNIHTFSDEVTYINSYCEVMKLRYDNEFKVNIYLEDGLREKNILKMLIQPIIENSIIHGFRNKSNYGEVQINIFSRGKKVIVEVIDNGCGISQLEINMLISSKSKGIGVYNTNRRVQIYYGNEYGITMESVKGEYTKTTVTLPYIS